jgi:hypothetical protein
MLRKIRFALVPWLSLALLAAGCSGAPTPTPSIARHPAPVDYSYFNPHPASVPTLDPNSQDHFQIDFRSSNLQDLDLSDSLDILRLANFDSQTQWPPASKLPAGFSPRQVMELGKDPGLGIRSLQKRGITGKRVGIAIIDQVLLVDHVEYQQRVRVYEEAEDVTGDWIQASMHGPAVASIAVGKSVGVAPGADLYFIASGGCYNNGNDFADFDFSCLAKDVLRVVEINQSLPEGQKIRVLSMSIGWDASQKGYETITSAVETAKAAGIFVVSSSIYETYGYRFMGMWRDFLSDPNRFESYDVASWERQYFLSGMFPADKTLMVPMEARATASPTGLNDYAFYGQGGWSWAIPYVAAMYALACQVDPGVTPAHFWELALQTGRTI